MKQIIDNPSLHSSVRIVRDAMKHLYVWCALVCIAPFTLIAQDVEDVVLTYSDTYVSPVQNNIKIPILSKQQRSSNNAITIVYKTNGLSEEVTKCLEYAIDIWKANIRSASSIFLEVNMADLEEDIRTDVHYTNTSSGYAPLALSAYLKQTDERPHDIPDGIISINKGSDWDYNVGENIVSDGNNLTFGIMRAIALTMGFGSSVRMNENNAYYFSCKRGYSLFDKLVVDSNGQLLTSISVSGGRPNAALKSYVEASGKTFSVQLQNAVFPLQSPPFSMDTPPFTYVDNANSLMRGTLQSGSYILQVDADTQAILNGLGWNIERQAQLTIISDDVPDTGLASAYEPHVFRIANTSYSVSNPTWKFSLPLADGSTQVKTLADNNLSCRIEAITDETPYKININGDIEGTLSFSCHINGKEVNATPFKIFLELKPLIENAEIVKIVDNSPYASYDAYYKVKYRGADKIKVDVEEEYSSIIKSCYIQEPCIAVGVADHITSPYYAWIDFSAENQYGKSTFTIELQPYGVVSNEYNEYDSPRRPHSGIDSGSVAERNECYVVFDIYGNELTRLPDIIDIKGLQYTGFIIIRHFKNGSCIETNKMLLR